MTDPRERLAEVLTPVAPPVVLEGIYTDDEHGRLLDVIKLHGPWPSIIAHHFQTVDEVIAWWYGGPEGGFTYWPEGPLRPPERLASPMWNTGVVVENEYMFHRGDPVGPPEERDIPGLKHRSMFGYREPTDDWVVTTDDEVIRAYSHGEMRLLVNWSAEVYEDLEEARKVMDHTDDLTHDRVIDTLVADLRGQGKDVAAPSDPFHDEDFIQAVMHAYTIAPTIDWMDEPYHGAEYGEGG